MSGGQEGDMSLLQREGRPEENVSPSLGEATRTVRTAARLHSLFCCVATGHSGQRAGDILRSRPEMMHAVWITRIYYRSLFSIIRFL